MSNRHLARTMAMQALFEVDFRDGQIGTDDAIAHIKDEFAANLEDNGYVDKQVRGVLENVKAIDELLQHFAPEWPISEMTSTDRSVLRLGAYELKFDESIPSKVAINEAIELGKAFGGSASGKFVNGVLGAIYKDMVATGKLKEIDKQEKVKIDK
jgi:N utilization substance protein B